MNQAIYIFLFLAAVSEKLPAQSWIKIYNSMNCWADYVIENYDKGYLILGTRFDAKYGWIIKTDINGNMLWNKKIGNGIYLVAPRNIERTLDNGYIIGGTTTVINNQEDPFLLKLNSCGEVDWCKVIHTASVGYDLGEEVKQTPDGGYVLLGMMNDNIETHRIHLFRFDSGGDLLWHHYYLPDSLLFSEEASRLIIDEDGYIITGSGYFPDPGQPGGWLRPYFIKTDTAGNPLWKLVYVGNNYYHGDAVSSMVSSSGNYYSAGRHLGTNGDSPALIKYLHNGTPSYNADLISNSYLGLATNVTIKDDTTLIFSGGWSFSNISIVGLIKSDTSGNVLKTKQLITGYGEVITSTAKTFDNKFVSVMTHCPGSTCAIYAFKVNGSLEWDSIYTFPFTYDSLCPYPIVSDTLDLNCTTVGIEAPDENSETTKLKVYPNPASGKIIVEFPKYLALKSNMPGLQSTAIYHQWRSTIFEVYDLNGKVIFSKEIPKDQATLELYVSGWLRGMYLFRLRYKEQPVAGEKVIIK